MDNRAYEANASATPPTAPASPSSGYPKSGDPQTSSPATKPGPYWVYAIGEEVRNVITGAGLTPDLNDLTQLRAAILSMISSAAKAIRIDGATFEGSVANGEAVRWDSTNSRFDEAIADGTANNQAVGFADVTNSRVYVYGETPELFSGLTPGSRYYLSATTAGAVTTVKPSDGVIVGIAKSATTLFVDIDAVPSANYPVILGATSNLLVLNNATNPNHQLDVSADEVVVKNAANDSKLLTAFSATADITVGGVNGLDTGAEAASTWYYLYAIARDDGTRAVLLSASATTPTMPSGYTYKALISAWYNDGVSNLMGGWQEDREFFYHAEQTCLSNGSATSETSVSLAAFVPGIAKKAILGIYHSGTYAAGSESITQYLRVKSGLNFRTLLSYGNYTGTVNSENLVIILPLIQQSYWYLMTYGGQGATTTHKIMGYKI